MASIYEITADYLELLDMAEDPEMDPQVFEDTLEAVGGELECKAESYAKVMRQLESDAAGLKAEIDRLTNRRRTIEANVDRMKRALTNCMYATGKTKFKTELFSFGIQKNPASLHIDCELKDIPKKYLIRQDPKIDKVALKKAILEGTLRKKGVAHLEQTESLRIR